MSSPFSEKNALYVLTILEAIEKIKIYSGNLANSELLFEAEDQMPYNAICHLLLAIGEETKKIEPGLKETQGFISWDEISGLRTRTAHGYRGIDRDIVYQVVFMELDILKSACEKLLRQLSLSRSELNETFNRQPSTFNLQPSTFHLPN